MSDGDTKDINKKRKKLALGIFLFVLAAGLIVLFFYTRYIGTHLSTDDAFVESIVHTVSPRVQGTALKVHINDNESVKAGQLLVELDPAVYAKAAIESGSALEAEKKRLSEAEAAARAQETRVKASEATLARVVAEKTAVLSTVRSRKADYAANKALLKQAETDLGRAEALIKKGFIPQERYDRTKTSFDTARPAFMAAGESLKQAEVSARAYESTVAEAKALLNSQRATLEQLTAGVKTQQEVINTRKAQADIADLNLSYTKIYAPADGYVTKKNVETGNRLEAGTPIMAIVSLKDTYIVANYKETNISKIKPGQRVKIEVDTYPGKVFQGHVDSIMAGTGSAFSLFPPENATGNYVKVVQRVPVKILIDDNTDSQHILRVGMSVVPTILVE